MSAKIRTVFSPELQLLLECCQLNVGIPPVVQPTINWELFAVLIREHRVINKVYPVICLSPELPANVSEILKEEFYLNKYKSFALAGELLRIIALFNTSELQHIPLKGPLLSYRYTNDFTNRTSKDLDIFVEPRDLEKAIYLLNEIGYALQDSIYTPKQRASYLATFHHFCFYNKEKDLEVELHWHLHSCKINFPFINYLWNNADLITVNNLNIRLLSNIDNFLHLCIHGVNHKWRRIFWVYDIAYIIANENQDFLIRILAVAEKNSLAKEFLQTLDVVVSLFDITVPTVVKEQIQKDASVHALTRDVYYFIETQKPGITFFETMYRYYLQFSFIYHLKSSNFYVFKRFISNP